MEYTYITKIKGQCILTVTCSEAQSSTKTVSATAA